MTTLFAATRRTQELIGRASEMQAIYEAVFPGNDSCQILFIKGRGGFGKTRLLEETLWRLGNPSERNDDYPMTDEHRNRGRDWMDFERVAPTDLIDLIDTRLHSRNQFLRALRESLRWAQEWASEFNFNTYDAAINKYEQRVLDNVEYRLTQQAADEAVAAFWKDYGALANTRRIVLVVDTAEQLNVIASQWLIEKELIADQQLQFQAQKWLAAAIRKGQFHNTTLLLAGRGQEGAEFFKEIEKAAREAGLRARSVEAEQLTVDEVKSYFTTLEMEWRRRAGTIQPASARQSEAETIAETMKGLADNPERLRTLHTYTGGQPVRLALFTDLIVESRTIPGALKISNVDALSEDDKEVKQWELEEEVVNLLFRQPRVAVSGLPTDEARERLKQATLRRDILLALVRARMGLSAEQLHFVIDNTRDSKPTEWKATASTERLRQISETMEDIKELSIVKSRPHRILIQDGMVQEEPTPRLGLQDEIYRIFAEHMAPQMQLGKAVDASDEEERGRLQGLLARLSTEDPDAPGRYQRNYEDEKKARQRLYRLLRDWSDAERQALRNELKNIQKGEEERLETELHRVTPVSARNVNIQMTDDEQNQRVACRKALRELDLEYMHYAFSLDPDRELNNAYFDLADEFWRASDEEADILTQAEMWRILHDRHALKFVEWQTREVVKERGEETIDVLRRAAIQEDASRWIKRLALRREYQAAVTFADHLEAVIAAMPADHTKTSWQHTFVWGERQCWREFARILPGQGQEIYSAVENLKVVARLLERLAREDKDTVAIPEKQEKGFIGHPALIRLRRVVSVVCAHIAYGYTQLGYFREAVDYYSKAINYARETGARAHKATVLNNLSRALSEMGRQRALRICLDALELRQQLGADAPIGLSHSTLALIHNDQNNADRAWVEAAKAAIFFKRVDDPRGRGLANIQLGEALRRLAAESRYGRALPASQQELYRAAEEALNDALYIFLKEIPTEEEKTQGRVREPLRWIEARIEKGCLYRDRLLYAIEQDLPRSRWLSLRSTALGLLNEAAEEAMRTDWPRLELDARVNIAWTYYYADDFNEAEKAIQRSKDLISRIIGQDADLIAPGRPLPTPRTVEAYIYYQLSKLHGLRGRIAIDRFNAWTQHYSNEFESAHPGASNDAVHKAVERELQNNPHDLDRAVDAYQLGIAYAQLYSPRSTALSTLYNKLYAYLKKFNQVELRAFQQLVHQHPLTLRKHDLRFEDLGDLEEFLYESLGLEAANMGRE